jgi:cell wall-associated NlpC family hydrolase
MIIDINKYRGIPYVDKGRSFAGVNCWGLLYLFLKTEYNIEIPLYDADYKNSDRVSYSKMVAQQEHFKGWELINKPEIGAAALFKIGPMFHVGICVALKGKNTLSIMRNEFVELIDPKSILWKNRFKGWWKYVA